MNNSLDPIYNLALLNSKVDAALKDFITFQKVPDFTPSRLQLLARIVNDPGQPTHFFEIFPGRQNISYNIDKLFLGGWITQIKSDIDGRVRYVHPTSPALILIAHYYSFIPTVPGLDHLCPASSASNVASERVEKATSSHSKSSPSSSPKSPTPVTPP